MNTIQFSKKSNKSALLATAALTTLASPTFSACTGVGTANQVCGPGNYTAPISIVQDNAALTINGSALFDVENGGTAISVEARSNNSGPISITAVDLSVTADSVGIALSNDDSPFNPKAIAVLLNTDITVSDEQAIGLYMGGNEVDLIMSGNIAAQGDFSTGIDASARDAIAIDYDGSITMEGAGSFAIAALGYGNTATQSITFSGELTTEGENSAAIAMQGKEMDLVIDGNIHSQGYNSRGIYALVFADGSSNIEISGSVKTDDDYSSAINISGDQFFPNSVSHSLQVAEIVTHGVSSHGVESFVNAANLDVEADITTNGEASNGIFIVNTGDVKVKTNGNITTNGVGSDGIFIQANGSVDLETFGTIKTKGDGSKGINVVRQSFESGDVNVDFSGTIATTGGSKLELINDEFPDARWVKEITPTGINLENYTGSATLNFDGEVSVSADNIPSVTSNTSGTVYTSDATYAPGLRVLGFGGDAKIDSKGNVSTKGSRSYGMISVSSNGNAEIKSSGNVTTLGERSFGLYANSYQTGDMAIESTGNILTEGESASAIYGSSSKGTASADVGGTITTKGLSSSGVEIFGATGTYLEFDGTVETFGNHSFGVKATQLGDQYEDNNGETIANTKGRIVTHGEDAVGISVGAVNFDVLSLDPNLPAKPRTAVENVSLNSQGTVEVFGKLSNAVNLYSDLDGKVSGTIATAIAHGENGIGVLAEGGTVDVFTTNKIIGGTGAEGVGVWLEARNEYNDPEFSDVTANLNNSGYITSGNNHAIAIDSIGQWEITNSGVIAGAIQVNPTHIADGPLGAFFNNDNATWQVADAYVAGENGLTHSIIPGDLYNAGIISMLGKAGTNDATIEVTSLSNSGRIDLRNGVAGDKLTLKGDLFGNGGTLAFDVELKSNGKTDLLDVQGYSSETSNIVVNNVAASTTAQPGTKLRLVNAQKGPEAEMNLVGGPINSGLTTWSLLDETSNANGGYSLVARNNTEAQSGLASGNLDLQFVGQQLGHTIGGHATGLARGNNVGTGLVQPAADVIGTDAGPLWMTGFGGKADRDLGSQTADLAYGGAALGLDFGREGVFTSNDRLVFGLFGAFTAVSAQDVVTVTQTSADNYSFGGYLSWQGNGTFASLVVPVSFADLDYNIVGTSGSTTAKSIAANFTIGHRFGAASGLFAEPRVGFDAHWSNIDDVNLGGALVDVDGGFSASAFADIKLGHTAVTDSGSFDVYGLFGVRQGLADAGSAVFGGVAANSTGLGTTFSYGGGVGYTSSNGMNSLFVQGQGTSGGMQGFNVEGGVKVGF